MKHALIVVTSHAMLGATGQATGYYLSEVSHPYVVFRERGYEVDFASPLGGAAPMDPGSRKLEDRDNAALLADTQASAKLAATLRPDQVDTSHYDVIFFAGGMGTMWDFAQTPAVGGLARRVYEQGGVVSAVCHGPAALVNVRLADGTSLIAGKSVTGFSNDEEVAAGHRDVVPFMLETALVEHGAKYSKAPLWQSHVEVSGRLVTGQNPASARGVAEAAVRLVDQAGPKK